MRARAWDRLAALLSIALLGALALGAYYLAEIAGRNRLPTAAAGAPSEPDTFVDGLALTRIDAQGQAVYRVQARRSLHYPDDRIEMTEAIATSLDPKTPRIVVRADRGEADSGAVRTRLSGNVVLTRAADGRNQAIRIVTDEAVVLSGPQIVRTDRPVRITHGRSFLTGVGMEYDNVGRRVRVDSQVRASWYDADRASASDAP